VVVRDDIGRSLETGQKEGTQKLCCPGLKIAHRRALIRKETLRLIFMLYGASLQRVGSGSEY